MMLFRLTVLFYLVTCCTGCATILAGKNQNLTINSNPPGANCQLTRQGEILGSVNPTPGATMVIKTKHDISVLCKKDGYQDGTGYLKSGNEGSTLGNIILGGGIGWAIDSAAGADNKYPEVTTVNLAANVPDDLPVPAVAQKKKPIKVAVSMQPAAIVTESATKEASGKINKEPTADRLKNLEDLKDKKLISEDDYNTARQKIIGEL